MDSCLRRIFLEALEVDIDFLEGLELAAEIERGPIWISHLPGGTAFADWRRCWEWPRYRPPAAAFAPLDEISCEHVLRILR